MSIPRKLARLFKRTENAVIAQLYTNALCTPLLVEPDLGEALIDAYMQGAVDSDRPGSAAVGRIAIINISGALASRPMPGPSGDGPANYEQLTVLFESLIERADIDGVVLRLDSPGGMASGLFDFTDKIFEARAKKPVIAVIDDIAYSAAYAIAAAADEIWISRTSGVGSVGVVTYHVDVSERDKAEGFKVTYVFAGARKVDFSPHLPLSEEAFKQLKSNVDRVYDLFVERVGTYRKDKGLTADRAKKSEALIFHGQPAIKEGFADNLGTLQDALQSLSERLTKQDPLALETTTEEPDAMNDEQQAAHDRGLVTDAILQADLPGDITKALLARTGLKPDAVSAVIADTKKIAELCTSGKQADRALSYIKAGKSPEEVREDLNRIRAEADLARQTDPMLQGQPGNGGTAPGLWDKAVKSLGGKVE